METIKRWLQKKAIDGSDAKKVHTPMSSDLQKLRAYGDQMDDGAVQLSFTLPVAVSEQAKAAASLYSEKMGLKDVYVATMEAMGKDLTFFVIVGYATHFIDFTKIKIVEAKYKKMDFDQIHNFVRDQIGRSLVVVGATTGSDAHTVGIDAIINMKGYAGDYGLERYSCFKAFNLRSQVSHEELLSKAVQLKADAILVSKVVTQRGQHLEDLEKLIKQIKSNDRLPKTLVTIVGGPRISHELVIKLGYDAGFGPHTLPSEVASFLAQEYVRKKSNWTA